MGARPFVSVKFSPMGRAVTFLVPDLDLDAQDPDWAPPVPGVGDTVVVRTDTGETVGTVQRPLVQIELRVMRINTSLGPISGVSAFSTIQMPGSGFSLARPFMFSSYH